MTFSIVGFCYRTNMSGVAITTSSIAVGSRCPWVRSNAGAVTSQNVTDPSIGNDVLDHMEKGNSSQESIECALKTRCESLRTWRPGLIVNWNLSENSGSFR